MPEDREPSFDAFRGLAVIAVVATHAAFSGFSWKYSPTGRWNLFFLVAYCQVLNFAVPAFVFMSGYWLSKKPMKSLEDYKAFLTRRLSRVLIPYFFWSFILLGYAAVKTGDVNGYQIIFKLMTGRACYPYYPYYFILMIAQFYVITPVLHYINRKPYGLTLVLVLNILALSALYLSRLFKVIWHLPDVLPFYSWIIFYEIGLLTGGRDNKTFVPKNTRLFILPAILFSLLISGVEGMAILSKYNNVFFAVSITRYSSFLYSACIILGFLFVRERFEHWPRLLVTIGKYSFGIFLIHMMVLNRVVNIVQKSNTIYSLQPLYQFIVVLITISICFALISITRKLLPQSFCSKILGF
jgi:peptidoglycan/LPS O-acetylase OafA/YrhL